MLSAECGIDGELGCCRMQRLRVPVGVAFSSLGHCCSV